MAGGANNSNNNNNNSQTQNSKNTTTTTTITTATMANQNQNNQNFNRFTKTKSGSLPGRYTTANTMSSSVLLSPTPYSPPSQSQSPSPASGGGGGGGRQRQGQVSPASISPSAYYQNYSPRPYSFMPATRSTIATTQQQHQQQQQQQREPPTSPIITSVMPPGKEKEHHSKKWNPFGGLFKRKDKHVQHKPAAAAAATTTVASIPIKIQFEASQRPPSATGGTGVMSSGISDDEVGSMSDAAGGSSRSESDTGGAGEKKRSNFLTRKLSRGDGNNKKKKQPKVVHADLLRVPASSSYGAGGGGPPGVVRRHPNANGRSISASNPQNRYSQPILQSWETTKKIAVVPPTSSSSLLMLNQANNNNVYAYSDSGSLSLSLEGSSSLTKGSKAATKARAEARRNSYIYEDSSSEDEVMRGNGGGGGGGGNGSGSYHGSHSSLSLRNKKNGYYKNGNGGGVGAAAPARPVLPVLPSADNLGLPLPPQHLQQHFYNQSSTSSPTLLQQQQQRQQQQQQNLLRYPSSPRWEARVVYTQETLEDDDKPVVVKLPKYTNGGGRGANAKYQTQETLSSDVNLDGEVVVTAGLKVPLQMHADRVQVEPIYANMKSTSPTSSSLLLPPKGGFHRPVSCSFLDSYSYRQQNNDNHNDEPQSLLQYEKEPVRLRSPLDDYDRVPLSAASVAAKLLPTPSSPVHSRAANFWKQKELESLQQEQLSNSNSTSRGVSISPSPVRDRPPAPVARIRSADSSPLLQPKHTTATATQSNIQSNPKSSITATPMAPTSATHRSLNSTESISSLSSFTTNETHSPSPSNMFKNSPRPPSRNTARGKLPAGHQQRSSYRSNRLSSSSSAAVAALAGRLSPTARSTPITKDVTADDAQNNNSNTNAGGSRSSSIKSPGRNLEDALNELEDMYKSLQLSDEDLLDRAERRDLPTPHQELRNKDLGYFNFDEPQQHPYLNGNGNGHGHGSVGHDGRIQSPIYYYSPSPTGHGVIGSLESLASGTGTSGSGDLSHYGRRPASRVRAPPLRRAGVPDPINDDMAKRKYDSSTKEPKVTDAREQISQTGSYLVLSPAFSPPVSPIPGGSIDGGGNGPYQQYQNYDPSQSTLLLSRPNDPDLTHDDVTVRNYKRANAIRIIPEPQPKFGIPLGPITKAPNSDYLHATPMERYRPLYRHVKNPDLVKDDIAFRTLRKDLNQEINNLSSCQWTPKLFSPLRNFENVFNYNEGEAVAAAAAAAAAAEDEKAKSKKLRAVRSLSANISTLQSNLMGRSPSPTHTSTRQPSHPVNSFYSLAGSKELGNNSDYKFYKTPPPASSNGGGGSTGRNYMEPSWVQQIELEPDELRELKRSLSPTRVIPLIRSRDVNPNRAAATSTQQRTHAAVTTTRSSSSPATSDSSLSKPRRPWTDLILDSFEKEKEAAEQAEREREQMRQQHRYKNDARAYEYEYDDDEDVFMDALSQTPRDSPATHIIDAHAHTHSRPQTLLMGQKNRRGSWTEQNGNNNGEHVTQLFADSSDSRRKNGAGGTGGTNAREEFLKRKSWSDFPPTQSYSAGLYPTTTTITSTATAKLDFNPIPPPRRVKQINLEGFHSSTAKDDEDEYEAAAAVERDHDEPVQLQKQQRMPASILKQPYVTTTTATTPSKGETELDSLIHALVHDADTCGAAAAAEVTQQPAPEPVLELEPKRKRKLEIKARYPIDDDEEVFNRQMKPSTSSTSSIEPHTQMQSQPPVPEPPALTYTIEPANTCSHHDPITRLIKTINENLVPSLETSIRESETRMSQQNLASASMEFATSQQDEQRAEQASTSTSADFKLSKPKPLPRHKTSNVDELPAKQLDDDDDDDSSLTNSRTDKQSKEINLITSSRSDFLKQRAESVVTQPQPLLCQSIKSVPSIQITDLDTTTSTTTIEKSFLRPKKQDKDTSNANTITTGDNKDGSKRDSLSDAEGITLLKKLLSRENSSKPEQTQTHKPTPHEDNNYFLIHSGIKKSPSTGTTSIFKNTNNWSTSSANPNLNLATPPFLRKYFKDSPAASAAVVTTIESRKQEQKQLPVASTVSTATVTAVPPRFAPEPKVPHTKQKQAQDVLALNVAQKANLFMKLEHEQRFSKWRKNSEDGAVSSRQSMGSRFSTQPVTNQEISSALNIKPKVQTEIQTPQIIEASNRSSSKDIETGNGRILSKSKDDEPTTEREKRKTSISSLNTSVGSSPSTSEKKPTARIEPSCLSIKDRVSLFNRMSSIPTATVNPMPAAPAPASDVNTSRFTRSSVGMQSAAARAHEPSVQVVHRRSRAIVTDSDAHGGDAQYEQRQLNAKSFNQHSFRDQNHDLESHSSRHTKGKSLTVACSWDLDYASEDGEVSSGGQEVSDIISKSYDNSPMFRKKNWKTQIPRASLSREIWRKFGNQPTEHEQTTVVPNTNTAAVSDCPPEANSPLMNSRNQRNSGFVHDRIGATSSTSITVGSTAIVSTSNANNVTPSSSTTSNLLPILRVLSSSDDGLEPDAEEYVTKLKIDATSSQAKDPSKKSVRKYLKMRTATATGASTSTTALTTESFQIPKQQQQPMRYNEPIYDNVSERCLNLNQPTTSALASASTPSETTIMDLSDVQREGDLLIMKKHMPTVKRSSSQKASKNPLKALAARLDFRSQD